MTTPEEQAAIELAERYITDRLEKTEEDPFKYLRPQYSWFLANALLSLNEKLEAAEKQIEQLQMAVSELEPRAAFGDQCYQDRCENAYVEQSVSGRDRKSLLVEEIRRLQALPAKAPQAQEWQPIEKAPKTGRVILVHCPRYQSTFCVQWRKYERRWIIFGSRGVFLDQLPTCWHALPDDPPPVAEPTTQCPL